MLEIPDPDLQKRQMAQMPFAIFFYCVEFRYKVETKPVIHREHILDLAKLVNSFFTLSESKEYAP